MLEYDRIHVSEGTDGNKTNAPKECDICHYQYILDIGFKYESYVCYGCHDSLQKAMNFNVVIVSIKVSFNRIHFWYTSKDDAINIKKISDLKKVDYYKLFSL